MKKSELVFSSLLVPLDYIAIILAGISVYYIRYTDFFQVYRPIIFDLDFDGYFKALIIIAVLWIIIFALSGLYAINSARKLVKEIYRVVLACSTGFVAIVIIIFVQRDLFESRFIVLAGFILAIVYVSLARAIVRGIQRQFFKSGVGVKKVVIIGDNKTADNIIQYFSSSETSGYKVIKRFRNFSLETAQELKEFLDNRDIDEIIQSDFNLSKAESLRVYDFADEHHLVFKYAADLLGTKVLKTDVQEIAGVPVVEVKKTPLDGWGRIIKRNFDIILSLILIIIFLPVLLLLALIIKLDSKGPIFYLDYRTGQFGKRFLFYKFRSMLFHLCDGEGPSATKEGNKLLNELSANQNRNMRLNQPLHKIKEDPRVTRVGKFIRRWSLDELPQLFNVLKGDISLVGPRPHMTLETAKYESHYKKVLTIKPGITGMAQISGRSDLSFEEEIKLDTYYIENWSLAFDSAILLRTPLAVIKGRKVA
ncbi:MAG: exopolysaccharide biosynthesis polyprenyl glycosylphosphotransferase [Patescibacteria group bacterium]|nr:exopolysaccharide biosynthesis polyprenyl glycosylphosphotransferase [Patescibacteria group bacterium]